MDEFLRNYFTFSIKLFEIIAALTGVFVYKKYKDTPVKYFIWILIAIAIIELIGAYTVYVEKFEFLYPVRDFLKGTRFEENNWFYTLFWKIGGPLAYAFYFCQIVKSLRSQKVIKATSLIFLIISISVIVLNFDLFFTSSFKLIQVLGAFLIVMSVTLFLIELLQTEKILSFYKSINFYIATTLLLWYLITTPLIFYDVYFSKEDMKYVVLKSAILLFSIIFMYATFTIALIFCKPQNN